jgi:hypothetical protein
VGFFFDIIRDCRQGRLLGAKEPSVPVAWASAEFSPEADSLARAVKRVPSGEQTFCPEVMSKPQVREEGGGLGGDSIEFMLPEGPATRQVADPWLPGNTAMAELPAAIGLFSPLPNPGKQKQAGSESARTGTAREGTEQESASSDSVLTDVCSILAVGDSQVQEPLSVRPGQSTGNMSAETQGRRQAGHHTRAGSATPPDVSLPLSTPGPVPEVDLSHEMLPGATPSLSRGIHAEKNRGKPKANPDPEGSRVPPSTEIEPRKKTCNKGERLSPAEVFLSEAPSPAQRGINCSFKAPQTSSPPANGASEPRVQIGLLEVVVVSPKQGAGAATSKGSTSSSLASRLYLRNL